MGGGGGGAYPKNPDQIINILTINHVRAEDTRLLGGPGACTPGKMLKLEILKLLEMY